MTTSDVLAKAYVQQYWTEKPEPIKQMLRLAYVAGTHDFRGQAALAAMQGIISCQNKLTGGQGAYQRVAQMSVNYADALLAELVKDKK